MELELILVRYLRCSEIENDLKSGRLLVHVLGLSKYSTARVYLNIRSAYRTNARIIEYACHTNSKRIVRTRVSIQELFKYAYHIRTYDMHIRKRSSYDEIIFQMR